MPVRIKLGTKLAVAGALAVGAVGASTYAGWSALGESGNDSPAVQQSIEYERLLADVVPTPQYLVEPYLAAYRALRETRPAQRAELVNRIRLDRTTYDDRHAAWVQSLASDAVLSNEAQLRQAFLEDAYAPAQTFWQVTIDQFLPAVEAGRNTEAAALLDGPISEAFAQHRAAIDNVVTLATSRRDAHAASVADEASTRRNGVLFVGGVALLVLVAVGLLLARSLQRPVRRLADAVRHAREDLTRAVSTIEHSRPDSPLPEVEPLGITGDDELAVIADAFESVRGTVIDLAVKQTTTRRSVGELFVNLGRRNQALINRQLSFIDQLEQTEQDPDTLEDLFRLDHLATRMRRNAESLLVLAGAEQSRRWTESIDVAQVVRSALSEIEEYHQVDLGDMEPVLVRGGVVADLAHLLAELLENATSFSPPSTRVVVTGRMLPEGYVVSVIDEGIGMDAAALAEANRRIESVGRREAPSARVLGLHVVGCLAARHSIRVRLVASAGKGVTARVLLPPATIEPSRAPQSPIQAVAAAAPATYEHALSRLDDTGGDPAAVDELPSRRRRGPAPAPEPEVFDPWVPEPFDATSFDATAFDPAAFDPAPFDPAPFDAASPADEPVDPAFVEDLSSAIHASFDDGGAEDAGEAGLASFFTPADDDVWPPAAHDEPFAPDLPPLPDAFVPEPPLPWRHAPEQAPATFTSWRPDDPRGSDDPASGALPSAPPRPMPYDVAPPALDEPVAEPNGGLARRVRGAQLPDTGPAPRGADDAPRRSADDVRSQLSRFRAGVDRGRAEERRTDPDEGDRS